MNVEIQGFGYKSYKTILSTLIELKFFVTYYFYAIQVIYDYVKDSDINMLCTNCFKNNQYVLRLIISVSLKGFYLYVY